MLLSFSSKGNEWQDGSHSLVPSFLGLESEANMIANVIILFVIAILAALSIRKIYLDRRHGGSSCGYNCAGCSGSCSHTNLSEEEVKRRQARLKH